MNNYEVFDYKRKSLPLCVYNPWFDRRGYLYEHISEYGDVPADRLPYMVLSPASDDPEFILHCFSEHIHKELELTFIVTGEWRVRINGNEADVFPGDIYIVNPFEKHSGYTFNRGYPKYYITVIADTAYFARVMSAEWQRKVSGLMSGSLKFITVCRGRKDLYGLFDRLHESWTADDVPGMLSGVYTLFGELFGSCVATENAEPDPNHDFIVRVSDILEERFREPLSTGAVSAELGYSESYFCRKFRESFGTTFIDRLNSARIAYAKSLSLRDKGSIQAIANECGLPDYVNFSKLFRRYMGMPPGTWYGT